MAIERRRTSYLSEPSYQQRNSFRKSCWQSKQKTNVTKNKPVYLILSILYISKIVMIEY